MKQINSHTLEANLPNTMISIEDSEAVTREVVGTTLNYLAEEIEKSLAGEVRIEEVLEMVRMLAGDQGKPLH